MNLVDFLNMKQGTILYYSHPDFPGQAFKCKFKAIMTDSFGIEYVTIQYVKPVNDYNFSTTRNFHLFCRENPFPAKRGPKKNLLKLIQKQINKLTGYRIHGEEGLNTNQAKDLLKYLKKQDLLNEKGLELIE